MPQYLLVFTSTFQSFRLQELDAVATLENVSICYDAVDLACPCMLVSLAGDEDARKIGERSILIRHVWRCWAHNTTYDGIHSYLRQHVEIYSEFQQTTSFKVTITSLNSKLGSHETVDKINSFSYMDFKGPINLKSPQLELGIFEYHTPLKTTHIQNNTKRLEQVWVGAKICDSRRHLIDKYDLKKRKYIGNTSMEAEVSLLMANQALVRKGNLVYDPFAGTGSMLYVCAEFGAQVIGSDIDGRHMRGKGKGGGIPSTLAFYGRPSALIDCLTFDMTNNPWRCDGIFDAIVTDPPYGIRAGAKRLGRGDPSKLKNGPVLMDQGDWAHERPDYVPPCQPWEMSEVLDELLDFSHRMLKVGGRLVYWLPTVTDEYKDSDVPQHPGMKLIANSDQNFSQWSRRLITMEKHASTTTNTTLSENKDRPAHAQFRDRYFAKFEKV